MNIFPIIVRELRAEARHPVNYSLRMFGAALLTVLLGFFLWGQSDAQSGGGAFGILSLAVFCSIWIVVPLITADCISREKREGTLGLLFLTPLKPIEIILGKGTIHAVRSLTLLAAAIPILTVPFILGGISKSDVLWTLLLHLAALILSLSAGLLASSLCQQWTRAIILAEIFSALFAYAFFKLATASLFGSMGSASVFEKLAAIFQTLFYYSRLKSFGPGMGLPMNQIFTISYSLLLAALLACLLVMLFAARRLKKSWQENPPSARQVWIRKIFCTPRFWVGFLRRRSQSRLASNPIGWLQQYSWSARLSKWGWCAIIITIVSWFLAEDFQLLHRGCDWLKTAMLVGVAFSAVGSFQREKQNGALELLLVTPLREKQIIFGRLWGIWGQFLPAFLILLLSAAAISQFSPSSYYRYGRDYEGFNVMASIRDFIVVPIVGLYFAMRLKNFMAAWLSTCALTLFLPSFVAGFFMRSVYKIGVFNSQRDVMEAASQAQTLLLGILGASAAFLLYSQLKNRMFAVARS